MIDYEGAKQPEKAADGASTEIALLEQTVQQASARCVARSALAILCGRTG